MRRWDLYDEYENISIECRRAEAIKFVDGQTLQSYQNKSNRRPHGNRLWRAKDDEEQTSSVVIYFSRGTMNVSANRSLCRGLGRTRSSHHT